MKENKFIKKRVLRVCLTSFGYRASKSMQITQYKERKTNYNITITTTITITKHYQKGVL